MFFKRNKYKEKVIDQYGIKSESFFTMFMTYSRILTLRNEEQKEYVLKEFSCNLSNKYGEELATLFYTEFIPKYQGTSLVKELSRDGQKYIDADLCVHQHTHPTTFPLIEKVLRDYPESDGKNYLSLLFTFRKFNKTLSENNLDYYTIDKMQNLFMYKAMQEFGQDIFDNTANLLREYGHDEFLYDELDEQENLGINKWFLIKLIPFDVRKYF